MTKHLQAGDLAPEFNLADADGRAVALGDLRGRRVIVYFYPAAGTPGCTTEACDFRDEHKRLLAAGFVVLAISPDKRDVLNKFKTDHHLPFPLLSDPDKVAHLAYGTWGEKEMYGRKTVGVIRSTFVIDAEGRIERAMYGHRASGHVARLVRDLQV